MSTSDDVLFKARERVRAELDEARAVLDEAARRALVALDGLEGRERPPLSAAVVRADMTPGGWFFVPEPEPKRMVEGWARSHVYGAEMTRPVPDGEYDLVVLVYPRQRTTDVLRGANLA